MPYALSGDVSQGTLRVCIYPPYGRQRVQRGEKRSSRRLRVPSWQVLCLQFLWPSISGSVVCELLVSLHDIGPAPDLRELWRWASRIRIIASAL